MILNKLYPAAISRGMSKRDFFHSTPRDIEIFLDAYDRRVNDEVESNFERMKYSSWLTGLYVQNAIGSVISKKVKYPKKPYGEEEVQDTVIETREDMTKEEVTDATETFFEKLMGLQRQAELAGG